MAVFVKVINEGVSIVTSHLYFPDPLGPESKQTYFDVNKQTAENVNNNVNKELNLMGLKLNIFLYKRAAKDISKQLKIESNSWKCKKTAQIVPTIG